MCLQWLFGKACSTGRQCRILYFKFIYFQLTPVAARLLPTLIIHTLQTSAGRRLFLTTVISAAGMNIFKKCSSSFQHKIKLFYFVSIDRGDTFPAGIKHALCFYQHNTLNITHLDCFNKFLARMNRSLIFLLLLLYETTNWFFTHRHLFVYCF